MFAKTVRHTATLSVVQETFIMSAFRAVIDFTKQWIFFTKTGNEVTSLGSEAEKNRHPVRNITDTPYVPLDAVE